MLDENNEFDDNYCLDWSDLDLLDEEEDIDVVGNGENIDDYWAKGWLSDFITFRRYNYDSFDDNYYKVFPTRFRLKDFTATKNLRRILKKNADLQTIIRPLRITEEKSALHAAYQNLRHNNDNPKKLAAIYDYIKYYPSTLKELCIFKENKLIACSIFEIGNEAMYSDLAFWDLDEKRRGLGIMTVLLEMIYGQKLDLRYYYLGHYFKQNPNYQYKIRFRGLELYDWDNDCWLDFKDAESLLAQKLPRRKSREDF